MRKKPKVYVFIDAANIWETQKAKGKLFDLEKLKKYLKSRFTASTIEIYYYSAYPGEGTRDYDLSGKHRFFTFLKKGLGFHVRKKELKRIRIVSGETEHYEEKGDMDVEMTVDAMFHKEKYNTAVFFTGDSDFLSLVTHLRNSDKKVYVFSSRNNISEELRTGTDGYTDVLKIEEDIWGKDLKYRSKE